MALRNGLIHLYVWVVTAVMFGMSAAFPGNVIAAEAVSYTHLTLPTT